MSNSSAYSHGVGIYTSGFVADADTLDNKSIHYAYGLSIGTSCPLMYFWK